MSETKIYKNHTLLGRLLGYDRHIWILINDGYGAYVFGGGQAYYRIYECTGCGILRKEII